MTQEYIDKIINDTVDKTILKLKMTGLLKDNRKTAFQKTEELLREYKNLKKDDSETVVKLIAKLETALIDIETEKYFEIIPMIYFENRTREEIAEHFNISVRTVIRQKIKMINQIKTKVFSEDVVFELFL